MPKQIEMYVDVSIVFYTQVSIIWCCLLLCAMLCVVFLLSCSLVLGQLHSNKAAELSMAEQVQFPLKKIKRAPEDLAASVAERSQTQAESAALKNI